MEAAERTLQGALSDDREVAAYEVEKVVERGVLDRQCAIHVCFPSAQLGVERETPVQRWIVQADGNGGRLLGAEDVPAPVGIDHCQSADTNKWPEQT